MREQYDLFDPHIGARTSDPDTSHAAAAAHAMVRRADRRIVLLTHAARLDGLTDFELAAIMDRQQTSVGKRRGELRDLGLIADSSTRRPAPSGSAAIVWRITAAGLALAHELEAAT